MNIRKSTKHSRIRNYQNNKIIPFLFLTYYLKDRSPPTLFWKSLGVVQMAGSIVRRSTSIQLGCHSQTHSLKGNVKFRCLGHISIVRGSIWTFLKFCHLEFDKEDIADGFMAHSRVFRGRCEL